MIAANFDEERDPDRKGQWPANPAETTGPSGLGNIEADELDEPEWDRLLMPGHGADSVREGEVVYGRFQVVRVFPPSGQSEVYAAWDYRLEQWVALKFAHEWLLREARYAAEVPGSVRVLEYNTDVPRDPFLVMDLAAGGPADDPRWIDEWQQNPRLLVEKVLAVIKTIQIAHGRRVVHRDIKPGNILFHADLKKPDPLPAIGGPPPQLPVPADFIPDIVSARVSDWGVAARPGAAPVGQPVGSPAFAAPEQWGENSDITVDVFGLGATLYYLITGRFALVAPDEVVRRRRTDTEWYSLPPPPHEVEPRIEHDLSAVIMMALAREPADRYPSADALAQDLRGYLENRPVRSTGYRNRRRLWLKRNAALVVPVMLVALSLLGLLGWGMGERLSAVTALADSEKAKQEKLKAELDALQIKATTDMIVAENAKILAHKEILTAARTAAHRGDWRGALERYEKAIGDGFPDVSQLRVERLFGYLVTNDSDTLDHELTDLDKTGNLGPLAAQVWLVRGVRDMSDLDRLDAGRKDLAAALCIGLFFGKTLNTADAEYAEALLQARPGPMIKHLERAVNANPLHYPAQMSLLFALLFSGQIQAAKAQCVTVEGLFPESTATPIARAMFAILDPTGKPDRNKIKAVVTLYAARTKSDTTNLLAYLDAFAAVVELMTKLNNRRGEINAAEQIQLLVRVTEMQRLASDGLRAVAFSVPTANFFVPWYAEQLKELNAGAGQIDDGAFKRLMTMSEDFPEAMILVSAATNRFAAAAQQTVVGNVPEARRLFIVAADVFATAADRPTLLEALPQKYQGRIMGLMADVAVLQLTREPDPVHLRRLRTNVHRIVTDARHEWEDHREDGIKHFIHLLIASHDHRLQADWKLDTLEGAFQYRIRNGHLYQIGRFLLDFWLSEGADKKRYQELSSLLENWADSQGLNKPLPALAPPPRPK